MTDHTDTGVNDSELAGLLVDLHDRGARIIVMCTYTEHQDLLFDQLRTEHGSEPNPGPVDGMAALDVTLDGVALRLVFDAAAVAVTA